MLTLPPLVGFGIGRFLPAPGASDTLWHESLAVPGMDVLGARARQLSRAVADATADALAIQAGEYGLLWLLGLVLLLLWIA
jgi:hypothetical protein